MVALPNLATTVLCMILNSFNICIDARTQLLYLLYIILETAFLCLQLLSIFTLKKSTTINSPLILTSLLVINIMFLFGALSSSVFSVIHNITEFERNNVYTIPYLWENMNKKFFNPFDRGVLMNIIESIVPLIGCMRRKVVDFSEEFVHYSGKESVDWSRLYLYTLSEIDNSPMKRIYELVQQEKKEKKSKKVENRV